MSQAKEWGERLEKLVEACEARIAELERQVAAITPGRGLAEYLAAMSERDALRDRVAELEAQAAAPPECVVKLLEATKYRSDETGMLGAAVAKHYGRELQPTPEPAQDVHEWQPVDAEHPLTEADDGRRVWLRCNKEAVVVWCGVCPIYPFGSGDDTYTPAGESYFGETHPVDIIAVLRPKPAPEPPNPQPGEVWESVPVDGGGEVVRQGEIVISRYGLFCLVLFFDKNGTRADVLPFAVHGLSLRHRRYGERKLTRRVS